MAWTKICTALYLISYLGVSISDDQRGEERRPESSTGGPDLLDRSAAVHPPPATFSVLSNWLFDGIDISKVEDIDHSGQFLPKNMTDPEGKPLYTGLYTGPYFDLNRTPSNVTGQAGGSIILPCVVKQAGKNAISWIRRRDSHILSVDQSVFISDQRFRILRPDPGNEWNLLIKPLEQSDAGLYECQISTKDKMSHYIQLSVIVPSVKIEGRSRDIHAQAGSSVTLKCIIQKALHKPRAVSWLRENEPLNFGLNIFATPLSWTTNPVDGGRTYEFELRLNHVQPEMSGEYECRPEALPSAQVNLHIVKGGGTLAAMSDDRNGGSGRPVASFSMVLIIISITFSANIQWHQRTVRMFT